MNSLQRVTAALERRQPDRVPLFECVIDERVQQALLETLREYGEY